MTFEPALFAEEDCEMERKAKTKKVDRIHFKLSPVKHMVLIRMDKDTVEVYFGFPFTFQVLLPPYEEAIAIPPKEPPPQYMEA